MQTNLDPGFKVNSIGGGFLELRICLYMNSRGGGCPDLGTGSELTSAIGGALRRSVSVLSKLIRWTPHPVTVVIRENKDYIRVHLYSSYTTITRWGVLLIS